MHTSWRTLGSPWVGAFAVAGLLVATVGACSKESDDTGGGGSGATTTSNTYTTSFPTGSTTTNTGSGGQGGDPQDFCDAAAEKLAACPGQGGAGGGGPVGCSEEELCQAHCVLAASCEDIALPHPNYSNCMSCCYNPAGC